MPVTGIALDPNSDQFGGDGHWDRSGAGQPIVGTLLGNGAGQSSGTITFTLTSSTGGTYSFTQAFNQNLSQDNTFTANIPPEGQAFLDSLPLDATFSVTAATSSYSSTETGFTINCFATGTRVMTARGEIAVQDLRVGDLVVTPRAGAPMQPVVWLGHSRVDIARHPDPAKAAPILIKAGALADGVPHRDLRVSPEHAMFLDGHLVPARLLVNGSTIVQETWCPEVTYWHVELPAHGLLISEGAVSESYFDDGNRKSFDNFGITTLFKDFESERHNGRYESHACYPLMKDGPDLERIRARIAARADEVVEASRRVA